MTSARTGASIAPTTKRRKDQWQPAMEPVLKIENSQDRAQVMEVVAQIISLVQLRSYLPGERIPSEREIADRFVVGRAVVREAMAMLEAMRYLERRRGSGVFMSRDPDATSLEALVISAKVGLPLSPKVNRDSIEVRRIIEVQTIGLACGRRTEQDLQRLRLALKAYDPQEADQFASSDYDAAFHLDLIRCTGNDILIRLLHPFYLMSRPRREAFFADSERRVHSHAQHLQLFQAVEAQDVGSATELMAAHIGRVDQWFQESSL